MIEQPVSEDAGPYADAAAALASERMLDPDAATVWERIDWIAVGVLMIVSLLLVGLHVRQYPTLSPIDELQHIDYVIKAGDFEIPRRNDLVGQEAMAEAACRSVDSPGYIGPLCGSDVYEPENFQENGVNTAAGQYPAYYMATGLFARALTSTGIVGSDVTAARMAGGLWAGAAWAVMWYLLAVFRIPRVRRLLAVGVLMATPLTLFHASTVNADAVLLLTGALTLLATVQYERRRLSGWWLGPIYLGLYLVEPTNLLVISAGAAYLLLRTWQRPGSSWFSRLAPIGAFVMVAALRLELAQWIFDSILTPSPPSAVVATQAADNAVVGGVASVEIVEQVRGTFSSLRLPYLPPFMRGGWTEPFLILSDWVVLAALFAAASGFVADRREAWLARFGALTMLLAGPFYTFSFAITSNTDFPAPARFGLPLLAFAAVAIGSVTRSRSSQVIVGGVAVGSLVNLLILMINT